MGRVRDSFETSLEAAVELDVIEPDKHAAVIEGARIAADAMDAGDCRASMLTAYLGYCKALGLVPTAPATEQPVVGAGRVARMRANSRAKLRAV